MDDPVLSLLRDLLAYLRRQGYDVSILAEESLYEAATQIIFDRENYDGPPE